MFIKLFVSGILLYILFRLLSFLTLFSLLLYILTLFILFPMIYYLQRVKANSDETKEYMKYENSILTPYIRKKGFYKSIAKNTSNDKNEQENLLGYSMSPYPSKRVEEVIDEIIEEIIKYYIMPYVEMNNWRFKSTEIFIRKFLKILISKIVHRMSVIEWNDFICTTTVNHFQSHLHFLKSRSFQSASKSNYFMTLKTENIVVEAMTDRLFRRYLDTKFINNQLVYKFCLGLFSHQVIQRTIDYFANSSNLNQWIFQILLRRRISQKSKSSHSTHSQNQTANLSGSSSSFQYNMSYEDFFRLIESIHEVEELRKIRQKLQKEMRNVDILHESQQAAENKKYKKAKSNSSSGPIKRLGQSSGSSTGGLGVPLGVRGQFSSQRHLKTYRNQLRVLKETVEARIRTRKGSLTSNSGNKIEAQTLAKKIKPSSALKSLLNVTKMNVRSRNSFNSSLKTNALSECIPYETLMDSNEGRKFFKDYLNTTAQSRAVELVELLTHFKQHPDDRYVIAQAVMKRYITTAPPAFEFDKNIIRRIEEFLRGNGSEEVFYQAKDIIDKELKFQWYPYFIISPFYSKFVKFLSKEFRNVNKMSLESSDVENSEDAETLSTTDDEDDEEEADVNDDERYIEDNPEVVMQAANLINEQMISEIDGNTKLQVGDKPGSIDGEITVQKQLERCATDDYDDSQPENMIAMMNFPSMLSHNAEERTGELMEAANATSYVAARAISSTIISGGNASDEDEEDGFIKPRFEDGGMGLGLNVIGGSSSDEIDLVTRRLINLNRRIEEKTKAKMALVQVANNMPLSRVERLKMNDDQNLVENDLRLLFEKRTALQYRLEMMERWRNGQGKWSASVYDIVLPEPKRGSSVDLGKVQEEPFNPDEEDCTRQVLVVLLLDSHLTGQEECGWLVRHCLKDFQILKRQLAHFNPLLDKLPLPKVPQRLFLRRKYTEHDLSRIKDSLNYFLKRVMHDDKVRESHVLMNFFCSLEDSEMLLGNGSGSSGVLDSTIVGPLHQLANTITGAGARVMRLPNKFMRSVLTNTVGNFNKSHDDSTIPTGLYSLQQHPARLKRGSFSRKNSSGNLISGSSGSGGTSGSMKRKHNKDNSNQLSGPNAGSSGGGGSNSSSMQMPGTGQSSSTKDISSASFELLEELIQLRKSMTLTRRSMMLLAQNIFGRNLAQILLERTAELTCERKIFEWLQSYRDSYRSVNCTNSLNNFTASLSTSDSFPEEGYNLPHSNTGTSANCTHNNGSPDKTNPSSNSATTASSGDNTNNQLCNANTTSTQWHYSLPLDEAVKRLVWDSVGESWRTLLGTMNVADSVGFVFEASQSTIANKALLYRILQSLIDELVTVEDYNFPQ